MVSCKMAISSRAKRFVASPIIQSVVNDIYTGRVIYSSSAQRSIVADNYKPRVIKIYDSKNAPWLNHYRYGPSFFVATCHHDCKIFTRRLRVPRYGAILEFLNFAFLLVLFILCLSCKYLPSFPSVCFDDSFSDKDLDSPHLFELLLIIFAAAFALDEYTASIQHGWSSMCRPYNTLSVPIDYASSIHCKREHSTVLR
jgi:hypothetical protein